MTPSPKLTPQESIDRNRQAKARKIYEELRKNGVKPEYVRRYTNLSWEISAQMAGYKKDKTGHIISEEVRGMVRNLFEEYGGKPIPERKLVVA